MAKIKCFDLIQHKELAATLKARFDKSVENIESETEQRSIGLLMALKHRDDLGDALNEIKAGSYIKNKSYSNATNVAKEHDDKLYTERIKSSSTEELKKRHEASKNFNEMADITKELKNREPKKEPVTKKEVVKTEKKGVDIFYNEEGKLDIDKVLESDDLASTMKLISTKESSKPKYLSELSKGKIYGFANKEYKLEPKEVKVQKAGSTDDVLSIFPEKDDLRPTFTGIYYDAELGNKVATDGHKIIIVKSNIEGESRILSTKTSIRSGHATKEGEKMDGIYPKYMQVIPLKEYAESTHDYKIDDLLAISDQAASIQKKVGEITVLDLPIGKEKSIHLNPGYLNTIIKAFKQLGVEDVEVRFNGETRGLRFDSKDGNVTALLMPVYLQNEPEKIGLILRSNPPNTTNYNGVKGIKTGDGKNTELADLKAALSGAISRMRNAKSASALKSANFDIDQLKNKIAAIENNIDGGASENARKREEQKKADEAELTKQKEERAKQKAIDDEAAAKKAEANKGKSKMELMNEGAAKKVLDSQIRIDGKIKTKRQFVEDIINEGGHTETKEVDKLKGPTRLQEFRMDGRQQEAAERKVKEAGKKTEYRLYTKDGSFYDVTKAEYDYANSLLETKEVKPEAPKEQPKTNLTKEDLEVGDVYIDKSQRNREVVIVKNSNNALLAEPTFITSTDTYPKYTVEPSNLTLVAKGSDIKINRLKNSIEEYKDKIISTKEKEGGMFHKAVEKAETELKELLSKKEQPKEEKPTASEVKKEDSKQEDLGAKNKGKKYEVEPSPLDGAIFQEVPKLRNILTKLAGNLGKNFKYSKVRQKFAGFYRPSNSLIAIKRANDISTVSHEMGHYLDDKHKMLDEVSPSLEKELSKYWGGGSKPDKSMSEEQQQIYRQQEGLAEWLRVFVLNPQEAMKSQEIYDLYISKVDKSDRDAISIFSNEIRTLLGQTKLSGISSVVHTDNPEKSTWAKRVFPKFLIEPFESKASFTTALLNQFFDSEEGFRKALRTQGIEKVIPSKDFIMLSRITLGHDDVFYNVMKYGMINEKYKRLEDSKTGEAKTAEWLFNPAKGKDFERDVEINRNRMIAERTVEFIDNLSKDRILEDLNRGLLPPDVILNKFPELRDKVLTVEMDPTTGDPVEVTVGEKIDQLKEKVKNPEISPITGEPIPFKPQPESRYNFAGKDVSGISLGVKDKKRYDYTVAKEALREYETHASAYPEKRVVYDELKRRYQELADDNLKYALKKGRLSQESYDHIKERNQQYIALSRIKQTEIGTDIFEDSYFTNKAGKSVGDVAEIIKQFKGSTKDIVDPYVALINSSYSIMKEANRNEAIRSFTEMLKGTRDMREGDITELADIGFRTDSAHDPYTITVYNKGEKENWRFDPAVYESLKGLDDVTHALPLALTLYAKILRPSVTTFPVFQARNRLRDLTNRLTVSDNWPSFRDYRNKKQGMMDYELHGGGQFGYHLRNKGSYYDMVEKTMKDVKTDSKTLLVHPDRIGEVYKKILGDSEKKTRIEEFYNTYDKYKKEGYSDYDAKIAATFAARDLLDFKVMGRSIRGFNQVIPFTNAKIQGFRRLYKAVEKHPGKTTAKFLVFGMIPQIANSLLIRQQDDKTIQEYKDLSIYRKTLFYNIPIHKLGIPNINWLMIPKPFEIGVMASAVGIPIDDMILDDKMSDQVNGDYVKFLLSAASPVDPMGIITAQGPIKAVLSNYDSFRQNYIVPDEEKDLDVRLRDTKESSRLGKLGQQLTFNQADPRQVDYMLKSLFSYYGDLAIRTSNIGRPEAKDKLDLSVTGFLKDTYDSPYTSHQVKWVIDKGKSFQLGKDPDYKEINKLIKMYKIYDSVGKYKESTDPEYKKEIRSDFNSFWGADNAKNIESINDYEERKIGIKKAIDDLAKSIKDRWESIDLIEYNKYLKNR